MSEALLRGREHTSVGALYLLAEGPAALAISLGGAAKTYEHTDPNEDACAFVLGEGGAVLAVADAHFGFEAAEVALAHLMANPAVHWAEETGEVPEAAWRRHALAALCDANADVLHERRERSGSVSCTTLTLAVVRPSAGQLLYASVGDSLLFTVAGNTALELSPCTSSPSFLGAGEEAPETLGPRTRVGIAALELVDAVVLATDGLSEKGIGVPDPARAVRDAWLETAAAPAALRPSRLARGVCEAALESHARAQSGDNLALACWVRPAPA